MGLRHSSPSTLRVRDETVLTGDPPYDYPDYVGTRLRHPKEPLVLLPHTLSERTAPGLRGPATFGELDHDLTRQHAGEPLGERISVSGRVLGLGTDDRSMASWSRSGKQMLRAAIAHAVDTHPAPLDPNFTGRRRCLTDDDGEYPLRDRKAGRLSVGGTIRTPGVPSPFTSRSSGARSKTGSSPDVLPGRSAVPRLIRSSTRFATSRRASGWSAPSSWT